MLGAVSRPAPILTVDVVSVATRMIGAVAGGGAPAARLDAVDVKPDRGAVEGSNDQVPAPVPDARAGVGRAGVCRPVRARDVKLEATAGSGVEAERGGGAPVPTLRQDVLVDARAA